MEIKFIAMDDITEKVVPRPVPARNALPLWFSNQSYFKNNAKHPEFSDGEIINQTVRACMPFLDAISGGYIQQTWCDIHLDFKYEKDVVTHVFYNYSNGPNIINHRPEVSINVSNDFHQVEMIWRMPWMPILPKGWSMLVTNPINRLDLPFHGCSAIIDSDVFYHTLGGNYPFFVKKQFNNMIIPAGTPMYQMIPIKRESWTSTIKHISDDDRHILRSKIRSRYIAPYKKLFHQKKTYK